MYDIDITELKYWFSFEDFAINDIQDLKEKFFMPGNVRNEPASINRKIYDTNELNEQFKNLYSNGTYTGFKSLQTNDFFSSEENFESIFNNISILKYIFQIANWAAVYNVDYPYYTLDNGYVICTFTKTSEPNGFQYLILNLQENIGLKQILINIINMMLMI